MESNSQQSSLEATLAKKYPGGEKGGWRRAMPAPDTPLERVVYFENEAFEPHWHIVSEGFRELGQDYELTLRLARAEGETEPHLWANRLMQRLGKYVAESGEGFTNYDYAYLESIETSAPNEYKGVGFVPDPELADNKTPEETAKFLQVILLNAEQLEKMQGDAFMAFIEELKWGNPLFIQKL